MLCLLVLLSTAASALNLLFLRHVSRSVGAASAALRYLLVGIPCVLACGWLWAFAGSFLYDAEGWTGGGWATVGLRFLSLIPLLLAAFFARAVWQRRSALARSVAVLELSATIVLQHPALLLLSLAGLLAYFALTVPLLAIFARLFLLGHYGALVPGPRGKSDAGAAIWHTDGTAKFLAWLTLGTWLWTWAVLRGIHRVTVAGVVSHWYFYNSTRGKSKNPQPPGAMPANEEEQEGEESTYGFGADGQSGGGLWPGTESTSLDDMARSLVGDPTSLEVVRASFARATGAAIGTICASAFVLAATQLAAIIANNARRASRIIAQRAGAAAGAGSVATRALPLWLQPLAHVTALLAGLSVLIRGVSDYVLVYVGITGDPFWVASKRAARLATQGGAKGIMDGLIIHLILDLTAVAFSLLAGVAGFLFSAHQLHVPADAPLVGLLCALLPYGVLRLAADTLSNA